jgi:hypothetical protein
MIYHLSVKPDFAQRGSLGDRRGGVSVKMVHDLTSDECSAACPGAASNLPKSCCRRRPPAGNERHLDARLLHNDAIGKGCQGPQSVLTYLYVGARS